MDATASVTPPDGGWGWVIVAAVALINMTNQSILSVFGLLFESQLREMQQETFTAALIINLNSLALNFSGLFIGPAIKSFKARNVAACGCIMVSFGLTLCAFASAGWQFIVGYSFFVGMGLGLIAPSTFMAINSYFTTKRGRAVGVSLAGAGLGQVFIPHIVRLFLDHYGFRAAVLSMASLSLCGLIGAVLLKPLTSTSQSPKYNNRKHFKLLPNSVNNKNSSNDSSAMEIQIVNRVNDCDMDKQQRTQEITLLSAQKTNNVYQETTIKNSSYKHNTDSADSLRARTGVCSNMRQRLMQAMDLELLKDLVFLSIIMGMALVYTSTIQFTMIFPSFLKYSVGMPTTTIASCMSIMAGADIICRLLLPCITDKLKIPYRVIFLLGTVGMLISRAALAESIDLTSIIVMSVFSGMTKSATVINNNLTISDHCRPEKLAGGLGLNMISKGIVVISIGQLLGWIRDKTNSYVLSLHAQNAVLLLVIVVWTPEIIYKYRNYLKQKRLNKLQGATSNELAQNQTEETEKCLVDGVNVTKNIC